MKTASLIDTRENGDGVVASNAEEAVRDLNGLAPAQVVVIIDGEMAACEDSRRRDLLQLFRDILVGDKPRPIHRHRTQRSALAAMAGITPFFTRHDVDVIAIFDSYEPALEHLPGRHVHVAHDGSMEITMPVFEDVRDKLEEHVAKGGKIERLAGKRMRAAMLSISEIVDRPRKQIEACPRTMAFIEQLQRRPGVLGAVRQPRRMSATFRRYHRSVMKWLRDRYEAGLPLPERPDGRSGVPHHEGIRLAIGPKCPDMRGTREYDDHIRKHHRDLGCAPESMRLDGGATVGQVYAKLAEIRTETHSASSVPNLDSALARVSDARSLSAATIMPDDLFEDVDRLIADAAATGKPLAATSRGNLASMIRFAQANVKEALRRVDDLPDAGHLALHVAILRSGKTLEELSKASTLADGGFTISEQMLSNLRCGLAKLTEPQKLAIEKLERDVFHTGGRIVERMTQGRLIRHKSCSAYYRSLSWTTRQLLGEGAHTKTDDELRVLVADVQEKALRQDRMHSKVLRASRAVMAALPEVPEEAPVVREIEDFIDHKVVAVPDLMRHPRGRWTSNESVNMSRRRLRMFASFCMMARSRGGLGLAAEDVSLALMLNWKVVASFLNWMAGRYAGVVHDGQQRGSWLTPFDLGFASLCVSLLDPTFGWITQTRERFLPRLLAVEAQLPSFMHLESLRIRMQADTIEEDRDDAQREAVLEDFERTFSRMHADRRIMLPDIVAEASADWVTRCALTRNRLNNLGSFLGVLVEKGRDPMEAIRVVVRSRDPMSSLREILERAQADIPDRFARPYEHAAAVRDILIFVLLCLTGLRSKNVRQLLYDPEGGGHISIAEPEIEGEGSVVMINIPWRNFKNLGSWHLFGRNGNKMDYERRLQDWYNLVPLFEHYVKHCRPFLMRTYAERLRKAASPEDYAAGKVRRYSRALFPTPSFELMDVNGLNRICHNLTMRYHIMDPKTNLVRPGHMRFGPHAVRDIIATHIIKASDDEGRWEIAADLLQTSVAMIKERYTKRTIAERTGRADKHFSTVSAGMAPLGAL